MNRQLNSYMNESEASYKSIFFVGECSWIVLEQYWVQDTSADFLVQSRQFFGDCMNSDPGSSLRSARNAFVKITKLFVKHHVNSFMHESESSSKSIFFVGECSWVVLEQNWVQDTSADFIV